MPSQILLMQLRECSDSADSAVGISKICMNSRKCEERKMRLIRILIGETQFTFFKGLEHFLDIAILAFGLSVDF